MEIVKVAGAPLKGKCVSCAEASISLSPSASSMEKLTSLCLLGKVVAPMVVNAGDIAETVTKKWLKKVSVSSLPDTEPKCNRFKLGFESAEDREWALDNSPWSFKGYTFVLRAWAPDIHGSVTIDNMRLWVQVHNLPHEYFSIANGTLLGNMIGKVVRVELDEEKPMSWKLFIRVQIDINIGKPLCSGCFFDLASGVKRWIQFKYEKIGIFCYFCGSVGHQRKGCSLSSPVTVANLDGTPFPMYGPWMSTTSLYRDVFSGATSKPLVGSSTGRPSGKLQLGGPIAVADVDGGVVRSSSTVARGSKRTKAVVSRAMHEKDHGRQKVWMPKKVPGEGARRFAVNGNEVEGNLNNWEKISDLIPKVGSVQLEREKENQVVLLGLGSGNLEVGVGPNLGLGLVSSGGPGGLVGSVGGAGTKEWEGNGGDVGFVGSGPGLVMGFSNNNNLKGGGPNGVKARLENLVGPGCVNSLCNEPDGLKGGMFGSGGPGCDDLIDKSWAIGPKSLERPKVVVDLKGKEKGEAFGGPCGIDCDMVGKNMAHVNDASEAEPQGEEERALSHFFRAQEELLYDLKHFGNLDLYEIKKIGGDIGVKPTSETNERTTPFKKRKFEGSASLCTRPNKIVRRHPDVVRDFPWDPKEKDCESKVDFDDRSEEPSEGSSSSSCNNGVKRSG
ncbi:hypothetical protein F8388_007595 [Cannabis sativa]|uniref:CCHC-type domain-containing protein n=1 Tax=Cannabis sativa TaxID=3483 RepID=A0A7J6EV58_CANSA|nr:hypothetical protein F8388_007595 [Cannabis sativa]